MHFSKTGKMPSLALGNSHLPVELFTVEWGHFVSLCHGDSASDRKWMPAVSYPILLIKVTPIMTVIKIVKLCVCFLLNQL